MENTIQRPLVLEIEDADKEILQSINNALAKMPCYIVEMILLKYHTQIKEGAKSELEMAKKQVEMAQKKNEGAE